MLFDAETSVVTPHMGWFLGGFQDQVAPRLTGRLPQRRSDRRWDYTLIYLAIEEAEFDLMETYI